jgi:FKBP-type peptidyl-prolyl cis-trans isomerase
MNSNTRTYRAARMAGAFLMAGLLLTSAAAADDKKVDDPKAKKVEYVTTKSGLKYLDEKVGTGAQAKAGNKVTVHDTGTLKDGKQFDSSRTNNSPFVFNLGVGEVIKGWDEGVPGMKVGGKRKLVIPSDLAYGERGAAKVIPPDAQLTFEVELLDVE